MIAGLAVTAKNIRAEESRNTALSNYLTQMLPSEEDHKKCKESDCSSIVAAALKNLSPTLLYGFVFKPFSEEVLQALPPEITAALQNNREAIRSFDASAPLANNANGSFSIGEDGRPVFGGTNPQKIVLGNLLSLSAQGNAPRRNISYIGEGGEEPGQSATGVNPSNGGAPSDPQGSNDAQAQQAEDRLLKSLEDQLGSGDSTGNNQKDFEAYRAAIQNELARKSKSENPSALDDFLRLYNPLNWIKDQDSSNINPIVTEARKTEIQKEIQGRLGGKRPGATDPAFLKGDQAEPTYNRPLTKEEQEELNRYLGTGGFYRTRDAQAGAGIGVNPIVIGNNPRPAPVADCGQVGTPVGCDQ